MSAGTAESALLELLTWEMGGFCITYEWMALVRVLKARPWKWKRVLKKWWVEMKREDLLKQIRAGMESTMAPVTGTAEFTNEGRLLEVVTVIQPQTPRQHEMLEQVAKLYGPGNAVMEKGNLVLRRTLIVNTMTEAVSAPQSESAATSASEVLPSVPPVAEVLPGPTHAEKIAYVMGAGYSRDAAHRIVAKASNDAKISEALVHGTPDDINPEDVVEPGQAIGGISATGQAQAGSDMEAASDAENLADKTKVN